MLFVVPRNCPVCKEQLWSDDQLSDPQFYRQRHASQYYKKHTTLKHPEFAKWDKTIQRYYAVAAIADGLSFILFFGGTSVLGGTDYFPSADTPIFSLLFTSSLALSIILVLIGQTRKRGFRDSWKKEHLEGPRERKQDQALRSVPAVNVTRQVQPAILFLRQGNVGTESHGET